jgi:hypothetical protein
MEQYQELAGVRIAADWKALQAAGVKPTATVSVKAATATVAELLTRTLSDVSTKDAPLAWYADGDVVRVTTRRSMAKRTRLAEVLAKPDESKIPNRPGEFDMDEVPLSEVTAFIRQASGVNIHVDWKALNLVGVAQNTPVTLKASGISFARALDLVTEQLGSSQDKMGRVYWVIDDGVVRISTGQALNEQLRTKIYDVSGLLLVIPNFESRRADLSTTGRTVSTSRNDQLGNGTWTGPGGRGLQQKKQEESQVEKRNVAREDLIEIVKGTIGRDMWQDGGGKGSVRLLGNNLIVSQTLLGFKLMDDAVSGR